jgi:hypothetical protein
MQYLVKKPPSSSSSVFGRLWVILKLVVFEKKMHRNFVFTKEKEKENEND